MRTICFCNSNIPWGGGEKWHLEAALSLADRGWKVLFLCHPKGELLKRLQGVTGIRALPLALGRLSFLNPLTHIRLTRLFKREGVDTLIMNLPADLKVAGPAARAAGVRRIVYRRGSALPVRDSLLNRRLFGTVITRLIVNSEATRRLALINNPDLIAADRISVLPNGLDVRAFDAALEAAGQSGGPPPGGLTFETFPTPHGNGKNSTAREGRPFILGNAGRLTRQKGQHLLLHLCRRLLDAGLDCAVVIAGTGEREAELKALAARLELGDRAVFPGFMENLAPFWRGIDLFVLSSLWEGFGTVLIEAMLARRPVFAFAVSNIPELVFEGGPGVIGNGRLFPLPEEERPHCPDAAPAPAAPAPAPAASAPAPAASAPSPVSESGKETYASLDLMTRAILELAADPESARRMGEAGRGFAKRFSQDACMDRLEELLT